MRIEKERIKEEWVRVLLLDSDERVVRSIEGRVKPGSSISIDGKSAVRRTGSISLVATEAENDLTNIDADISINKRVVIEKGIAVGDQFKWFKLGTFLIDSPSFSHNVSGLNISLNLKDKMALLNGDAGGGLPASITFHEYDQVIGSYDCGNVKPSVALAGRFDIVNDYTVYYYRDEEDDNKVKYMQWDQRKGWLESSIEAIGSIVARPQRVYDIILTLVHNYGNIPINKIFIDDVELEIKQLVRFTGTSKPLYLTPSEQYTFEEPPAGQVWQKFTTGRDLGYTYTDFTYPGKLISGIGENVTNILDKICSAFGNYEYFFDIDGNFHFQEKKNYLNTQYDPAFVVWYDDNGNIIKNEDGTPKEGIKKTIVLNGSSIIDKNNYQVDFSHNTKSVYTFEDGNELISSYSCSPSYSNIKNDFHIWGENTKGYAIHYHLAIKQKPQSFGSYDVIVKEDGTKIRIRRSNETPVEGEVWIQNYVAADWRVELYLQGLLAISLQQRPDVYQQEILDLFSDKMYNFAFDNGDGTYGKFLYDESPNEFNYWIDYLEPDVKTFPYSVDVIGPRVFSYQYNKINRIADYDIPDYILVPTDNGQNSDAIKLLVAKIEATGNRQLNIDSDIYNNYVAVGTLGYSCVESARDLLYQRTGYNESISLQSIPIYNLEPNTRITVNDRASGIKGDYIINSISLPLDAGAMMSISASKALDRV